MPKSRWKTSKIEKFPIKKNHKSNNFAKPFNLYMWWILHADFWRKPFKLKMDDRETLYLKTLRQNAVSEFSHMYPSMG